MSSILVAGRVNAEDKELADFYLRRMGVTSSDVIRIVWHNIASTGEIPRAIERPSENGLADRMRALRSTTPRSSFLETITPEGLKKELENRG